MGSALVESDVVVQLGLALDLTLLVPAYAVAAALLWRRVATGYVLATVLLIAGTLHQVSYMVALFGRLGRAPKVGDEVRIDGYLLRVEEVDGTRIAQVVGTKGTCVARRKGRVFGGR